MPLIIPSNTLRPREGQCLAQGHTAHQSRWELESLFPGSQSRAPVASVSTPLLKLTPRSPECQSAPACLPQMLVERLPCIKPSTEWPSSGLQCSPTRTQKGNWKNPIWVVLPPTHRDPRGRRTSGSQARAVTHLCRVEQTTELPLPPGDHTIHSCVLSSRPLGGALITAADTCFHSYL